MSHLLTIPKTSIPRDEGVRTYYEPKVKIIGGRSIPKTKSSRSLPTVMDITLGQAYIEQCMIEGLNYKRINIRDYSGYRITKKITLGSMYHAALYQVVQYNDEYGTNYKIGDEVQSCRQSSDNMEDIYGEPEEDRPDIKSFHDDYDPNRFDGDGRFRAMTDRDYDIIWDGGRWMHDGEEFVHQSVDEYFNSK